MAPATSRLGTCAVERAVAAQYTQARAMFASACRSPQAGPLVRASALRTKRRAGHSHSTMPSGATQQIARPAPALRVCTKTSPRWQRLGASFGAAKTSLHKQCLEGSFGAAKTSPRKRRLGASFERSGQHAHLRRGAPRHRMSNTTFVAGAPRSVARGAPKGIGQRRGCRTPAVGAPHPAPGSHPRKRGPCSALRGRPASEHFSCKRDP